MEDVQPIIFILFVYITGDDFLFLKMSKITPEMHLQ